MNNGIEKELPSQKVQKEYESNPSYILERIRKENMIKVSNIPLTLEKDNINNLNILDNKLVSKETIHNSNFEDSKTKLNKNIIEIDRYKKYYEYIEDSNNNKIINNNNTLKKDNEIKNNNIEKDKSIGHYKTKNNVEISPIEIYYINNQINTNFSFPLNNFNNSFLFNNTNMQTNIFNGTSNFLIKYNTNNIKYILSNLKNYWGSINLQNIIYNMNDNEISSLLLIILPYINVIMCLEYGNYFFQKLLKRLNSQQKIKILQVIEPSFPNIATNKSGTHSIQSLIDGIKTPIEQFIMDNLLNKNMLLLFNDKNAYHIIMKIIIEKPENQRNNINFFIINNIKDIIINPYGSYCVNKFIVNNIDIYLRELLLKNIYNNIQYFFFHKCSCSILLLLLKYYNNKSCNFIFEEVKKNIIYLIINPVSFKFVKKILFYLKNKDINTLTSFIWDIYKNDDSIKSLYKSNNGFEFINQMINFSNSEQKTYIKEKLNKIKI